MPGFELDLLSKPRIYGLAFERQNTKGSFMGAAMFVKLGLTIRRPNIDPASGLLARKALSN